MDFETLSELVYLAECAHAAYDARIPERLHYERHVYLHDDQKGLRRGYIGQGQGFMVVSIKGTATVKDFLVDGSLRKVPFLGRTEWMVHEGFNDEFTDIWTSVQTQVLQARGRILITGHSLGAAIATLVAFALKEVHKIDAKVVLLGSPRVGDHAFAKAYNDRCPYTWRIVNDMDLVPRIPKLFYWHVDHRIHLAADGTVIPYTRSVLKNIWKTIKVLFSDLDGESLRDHSSADYVRIIQKIGWGAPTSHFDIPKK